MLERSRAKAFLGDSCGVAVTWYLKQLKSSESRGRSPAAGRPSPIKLIAERNVIKWWAGKIRMR
jgi:hypothetical protein